MPINVRHVTSYTAREVAVDDVVGAAQRLLEPRFGFQFTNTQDELVARFNDERQVREWGYEFAYKDATAGRLTHEQLLKGATDGHLLARCAGGNTEYWFLHEGEHDSALPLRVQGGSDMVQWFYRRKFYETKDLELTPEDVCALIEQTANKRRLELQKAHALQAMVADLNRSSRRPSVPQDVKVAVWQRDGGRCVECDSCEKLEFDHIIPLAMGGANTLRNLQLLCETCNRRKGASLG